MKPDMAGLQGLPDFAPTYMWNLAFIQGAGINADISAMNYRCISADLPNMTGQTIMVSNKGLQVKQSGIYTPNTITLTFVETVDNFVMNLISDMLQLFWDKETGVAKPNNQSKFTVQLEELDREGNVRAIYTLRGCILEGFDHGGQLSSDGSDIFRPTMTLAFDYYTKE